MYTREQLNTLVHVDPASAVAHVLAIQERVEALEKELAALRQRDQERVEALEKELATLRQRVRELESQRAANSRNSGRPPSTGGLSKPAPKSLRKKTGRGPGGQKGRAGHALAQVEAPDHALVHAVSRCACGAGLSHGPAKAAARRQVFELPEPRLEVTEHRAETKVCPKCWAEQAAPFPEGVGAPAQYGGRFPGFLACLRNRQMLPMERASNSSARWPGSSGARTSSTRARPGCGSTANSTGCT